jgi:hypothetical protein
VELINQTPAVAELAMSTGRTDADPRIGLLTAKLTVQFDDRGNTAIDSQNPHPLYPDEQPTELGLLPSDAAQRRDGAFEVIINAAAHAPGGRPTEAMLVSAQVGAVVRYLQVSGDRAWIDAGGAPTISRPIPFLRMPLTFARAFGGTAETWVDADTALDVRDPLNHHGRGFDARAAAESLAASLEAPPGFPVLSQELRMLPNLEDPQRLITRPEDAPKPCCWSTVPRDIGFSQIRQIERAQALIAAGGGALEALADNDALTDAALVELHHRAHPDWILERPPPARARVSLRGLSPAGVERVEFELPQVRVLADYVLGERRGSRELAPQMLVLLPEEWRLCLVFRMAFTAEVTPDMERCFRLRLEPGWFSGEE